MHATVDYGAAEGVVEGSEFMPQGYSFTAALKVLCEGGVIEFMFRAEGVSVEMGGGNSRVVCEPGKKYALISSIASGKAGCRRSARLRSRG